MGRLTGGASCALALLGLIVLFEEAPPGAPARAREPAPRLPMARVLRYPRFALVVGLLLIAQFLDRGLALLIPAEERLAREISSARLLLLGLLAGGPLCAAMALARTWPSLLGSRDGAQRRSRRGVRLARPRRAGRHRGQPARDRRAAR